MKIVFVRGMLIGMFLVIISVVIPLRIKLNETLSEFDNQYYTARIDLIKANEKIRKLETLCPQVKSVIVVEENDEFRG